MAQARRPRSSRPDAGLNAHINYDLAYGSQLNLREHGDGQDHLLLPRRKFDHDQVNNILVRSTPQIAATLTRDCGGALAFLDTVRCSQRIGRSAVVRTKAAAAIAPIRCGTGGRGVALSTGS